MTWTWLALAGDGRDPEDPTLLYAGAGAAGVLVAVVAGVAVAVLLFRRERRLMAAIDAVNAEARRQVTGAEQRQAAIDAPCRCRLLRSEGEIILFDPGVFGAMTVSSEAAPGVVFVDDPTVSREHATVERRPDDPDALYVTDLGSSNGSFHQGLDLRGRGTVRVGSRERLQFGLVATLVDISET